MSDRYFLQDTRTIIGNCMVFWAKDAQGYTTDIDAAHLFTLEEALSKRSTDRPWPECVIRSIAKLRADIQNVPRARPKHWPDKEMLPSYDSLARRVSNLERKIAGTRFCPACRNED